VQSETRPRCDRVGDGLVLNLRGVNLNPGADADDMVSVRLWVTEGLIISARVRKIFAVDAMRQQLVERTDALEELALTSTGSVATDLAELRQSVIKLRRFVRPQSQAIAELSGGEVWPLDKQAAVLMRDTKNKIVRTIEELDATADRLQAIQDHLDVLHASALGRNSYVLSIVAAIFLPLGFLTGGFLLFFVFRFLKWL